MPPLSHPLWQQQPDLKKMARKCSNTNSWHTFNRNNGNCGFPLFRIWLISRKPKCYPTEISINQLQCWKGPVFTIKVLQKNTALKIWWDPGLVEIFCRAATRDWDWSSKYMSHLTTFINLPWNLFFCPISSIYAMIWNSSTGFFLAFSTFYPTARPCSQQKSIPSLVPCKSPANCSQMGAKRLQCPQLGE